MSYSNGGGHEPSRGRDYYGHDSRDRSRSRDHESSGRFDGRGGGRDAPRGFQGRNGGRDGYQGRGNRNSYGGSRPTQIKVLTNYFKIETVRKDGLEDNEWVQYDVQFQNAFRRKKVHEDGTAILDADGHLQFDMVPQDTGKYQGKLDAVSGVLTRRIMKKLIQEECDKDSTFALATDGGNLAFSPRRLFTALELPKLAERTTEVTTAPQKGGIYGPADDMGAPANDPVANQQIKKIYFVRVKKDCEEDDPEASRVRNAWFMVTLTEVATIPWRIVEAFCQGRAMETRQIEIVRQCLDIVLKSSAMETMLAVGKSPRNFYFPLNKQEDVMKNNTLAMKMFRNPNSKEAPLIGISQAIRFSEGGNAFATLDVAFDFFDRERMYSRTIEIQGRPIPLLDEGQRTIAGVRVRDLSKPITDRDEQWKIEEAISKLDLHIEYKRPRNLEWEEGKTPEQIEKGSTFVRRNKKMRPDATHKIKIAWAADNPDIFSFALDNADTETPVENQRKYTVAAYYYEKKKMKLKFPHLPIISIGRDGFFPIEFIFQAFGKKKDANTSSHVNTVLNYYDNNAATDSIQNIEHLKRTAESLQNARGVPMTDILMQYNFQIKQEPQELMAKVLPLPTLTFGSNRRVELRDGSWNLMDAKFANPADMSSFAVVDLVGDSNRSVLSFLKKQFEVMGNHGMELPQNIDSNAAAETITAQCNSREFDAIRQCVERAVENAQQYFLFDRAGHFRKNHVWFKTNVVNGETGHIAPCFVIPPNEQSDNLSIMLPREQVMCTHEVTWNGGTPTQARLKVKVLFDSIDKQHVDPFHFRFFRGKYEAQKTPGDVWKAAEFYGYSYELPPGSFAQHIDHEQCTNVTPSINVPASDIECPSVVFAYLPDDTSSTYHILKMVSKFDFGVQSQCVVATKFAKQRSPGQFCSNIALKLNTKLFSGSNKSRAWNTAFGPQKGIPWVAETPTLVIGIHLSHGLGTDSTTCVAATGCLDSGCMQMAQELKVQPKSDIVGSLLMQEITKSLCHQFRLHNHHVPERLLVYREGVADNNFDRIVDIEIRAIRQGLFDFVSSRNDNFECPNQSVCQRKGCVFCTPTITFVVCQSNSIPRVVPSVRPTVKSQNVPSGTCVDDIIMPFENSMQLSTDESKISREQPRGTNMQLFEDNDTGFDFLLVAHGGLKGTSKSIFYRTILNENFVWRKNEASTSLTKEMLQQCTYCMAFQYGTASKAIRHVPVVEYSKRLSSMAMGYVGYLLGRKGTSNSYIGLAEREPDDNNGEDGAPETGPDHYINSNMKDDRRVESGLKTVLLPAFAPYSWDAHGDLVYRRPFRPHLSA